MEVSSLEPMVRRFISSASLMSRLEQTDAKRGKMQLSCITCISMAPICRSTPDSKHDVTGTRSRGFAAHKSQNTARNVTSRFRILAVRQA